jgi:hypothetical protein
MGSLEFLICFALLGWLIQTVHMLCLAYPFDNLFPDQGDFELIQADLKDWFRLLYSDFRDLIVRWKNYFILCFPSLHHAYMVVYHSEHTPWIQHIIVEADVAYLSLFLHHFRGDTL